MTLSIRQADQLRQDSELAQLTTVAGGVPIGLLLLPEQTDKHQVFWQASGINSGNHFKNYS
jgi:hypothetical protein